MQIPDKWVRVVKKQQNKNDFRFDTEVISLFYGIITAG